LDEQITEGFGVGVFRSKGGLYAQFLSTPIVETIFHLLREGTSIRCGGALMLRANYRVRLQNPGCALDVSTKGLEVFYGLSFNSRNTADPDDVLE